MTVKKRLAEFDIMRFLAIFIILFHHLTAYSFNYYDLNNFGIGYDLSYINDLNRYFALGIFIYISGFLLQNTSREFNGVYSFLSRRMLRIIPLYLLALILYVKLSIAEPIGVSSFITHLFGLQVLLSTSNSEPVATLWYVGLIISYYFVFIIIKKYGTNPRKTFLIIASIPIIAISIKIGLGFIDKRFFIYYLVFIVGMYSPIFPDKIIGNKAIIALIAIFFISCYLYVSQIYPRIYDTEFTPPLFSIISLSALFLVNIIMISFATIIHQLCKNINVFLKYTALISYLSYCMYLFHRPVWGVMLKIYEPENAMVRGAYLALIGIPILIVISFLLQKGYDNILVHITKRRAASFSSS